MNNSSNMVLLGLEKVVSFHPELAELFGDIESALLFQQLYYWRDKGSRDDEFIYKTKGEIQTETYLNRYKQDKARATLESMGVIETKLIRANGSPVLHYRVNVPLINEILARTRLTNGKAEASDSGDFRLVEGELMEKSKVSDSISRSSAQVELMETSNVDDSITKTTTDTTTKITKDIRKKEKSLDSESKQPNDCFALYQYVSEVQDIKPFPNKPQQLKAAKTILVESGYTLEEAKTAVDQMHADDFWHSKTFDVVTLTRHITRYYKAPEIPVDDGPSEHELWVDEQIAKAQRMDELRAKVKAEGFLR